MSANWRFFSKNSGILLTSRVFVTALGALELSIVIRSIGIEQYGVLGLAIAYSSTVNQFFDLRVWETVIRYLTMFLARKERAISIALLKLCGIIDFFTGILAFLVVALTAPFAAHILTADPKTTVYIQLYAIFLLFSTLDGTTTATLRVLNHFSALALLRNLQKLIEVSLIAFFLLRGGGIVGILTAQIISIGFDALLKLVLAIKLLPFKLWPAILHESIYLLKPYFREIAALLVQTNFHATLKMINGGAEILLLGALSSPLQVGYYKLARQIIDLLSRVAEPFYEVIYPQLTGIWEQGKRDQLKRLIYQVTGIMAVIILPALIVLILSKNLVIFLISGNFEPNVNPLISIMAVGLALNFIVIWLHPLALISGKAYWTNITRGIQAIFWVVGSFLLVPQYGALGTASLYFINNVVWVLIMIVWVAKPILHESSSIEEYIYGR